MEYNFLAKYLINKLLIHEGEASGLISEVAFGKYKDHRSAEVALCILLLWYQLRQLIISGILRSTDTSQ